MVLTANTDLQAAINEVAETNNVVLGELRQAIIALTEETRRASADLVQALAKVAEANRESATALNEDVKWLRDEVRKIEPARRVVFVSYPSAMECGTGNKDCTARAETLCTGMGFREGLAASYQTAAATTGDKKRHQPSLQNLDLSAQCVATEAVTGGYAAHPS